MSSDGEAGLTLWQAWLAEPTAAGALEVVRGTASAADRVRRYDEWPGKAPPELPGAPLGEGFVVRGAGAAAERALGAGRARALLGELPPGSAVRWGPDGLFVELPREGWLVDARSAAQLRSVADRVGALAEALRGTA